ncbi:uncharacterized protein IL334_001035 [Kwoniella shivajii]|uniref:SET domain-containing protein n=1 Tax=Kwoniella shivajii TaxID=564305 RepID=A0ABZ1CQT7_9TREE|nr:hypothetical protein IL334_001035 [Kwoniella shivajii]
MSTTARDSIPIGTVSIERDVEEKEKEKEGRKERDREREKDNREKSAIVEREVLPHPAEDLSADDDLLSWILVDQLGCMPNTKLGVHPQQVKFVGPTFKTDDVLNIIKETVTKGNLQAAMQRLQEFHLIKSHLESKMTDYQRERFVSHLRRYLLPLAPNSRLEIHLTSRYSFITGHTELAVFATRPLASGLVMHELQGSVVPLPDQWRQEMEIGEDFAVEAAGEETDSESEPEDDNASLASSATQRDRGKGKETEGSRKGQRRSDRTKRRDFSIVWSGLKRCYQLFLGPARFLNHDCNPNVELLRQGKHVTFRVTKPIRVGDELTTFYGENYFGRGNIECLCLTCEQTCAGGFTPVSTSASVRNSRSKSRDSSAGPSRRATSADMRESAAREIKNVGPSSLRNVVNGVKAEESDDEQSIITGVPSLSLLSDKGIDGEESKSSISVREETASESLLATPTKRSVPPLKKLHLLASPTTDSAASEPDSPIDPPPRRERVIRKVVQNIKPWSFLQRPKKIKKGEPSEVDDESTEAADDLPSDFPRCASCAKPLTEQIWFNGRYFEHCARCVRHALIFELPWPAHKPQDVQEYPPVHLIPPGYIPRKISTIPLPTLNKQAKFIKPTELPVSPANESKPMRRARRLRDQIAAEEFFVESLREAAWSAQEAKEAAIEAKEAAIKAQREAKEEERMRRAEEKRKRDEKNIKGTGVWSRYAYLTEEEVKRREAERNQITSGTRRGGRFRASKEDEEMKKMAEEKLREEERERRIAEGLRSESDPEDGAEAEDEGEIADADTSSGTSTIIVVDPRSLIRLGKYPAKQENGMVEDDDEMEVAAAPELSMIQSPKKLSSPSISSISKAKPLAPSTKTLLTSAPLRSIAPKPSNGTIVTPAAGGMGYRRISKTFNVSSIIDMTMDSDDDASSTTSAGFKRRQGRPLGSGKHQKAAAKKLAKQQASSDPSASRSVSPIKIAHSHSHSHIVIPAGRTNGEKAKFNLKTASATSHYGSSVIEIPDSPVLSHHKVSAARSPESAKTMNTNGRSAELTHKSTPSSSSSVYRKLSSGSVHCTPSGARFPNGSGSSSVDAAEVTLDIKGSRIANGRESPADKKGPRLILKVQETVKGKERERSMSNGHVTMSNGTGHVKPLSNGHSSVINAPIEIVKPFSNGNGIINGNEQKRKRISDVSEASTSSPSSHPPEKKKRVFFPPLISVAVPILSPNAPIPTTKHSFRK